MLSSLRMTESKGHVENHGFSKKSAGFLAPGSTGPITISHATMVLHGMGWALMSVVGILLGAPSFAAEPVHMVMSEGHHHANAADAAPPESNVAYSLFMHRSSGVAVILISGLLFADRRTGRRKRSLAVAVGAVWLLLGIFLLIWSDPEAWPIGPTGFIESFSAPAASEWLQHKLLALVPCALGLYWIMSSPGGWQLGRYVLAGVAGLGVIGLLRHQHAAHPGMDWANLQHRFFAVTALFIAMALMLEGRVTWKSRYKIFLLPIALLVLGLQLLFFTE